MHEQTFRDFKLSFFQPSVRFICVIKITDVTFVVAMQLKQFSGIIMKFDLNRLRVPSITMVKSLGIPGHATASCILFTAIFDEFTLCA